MNSYNKVRWIFYALMALGGILLIIPWRCHYKDIMLNLGTGFIASCLTACVIEIINAFFTNKQNNQKFIISNNDIRAEILTILIVYNRLLNEIAVTKKVKKFSFENKTFPELLNYYIVESDKIKSYTAPYIATNGILSADELEQNRLSVKINKIIASADEELRNIKIRMGKIADDFAVAKAVQLSSGICSDDDIKCMNGLFSIFSLETSQIPYEAEFYQFAHCFSEIQRCIPEFYKRLGLNTIKFTDNTGYLDITSKSKGQKGNKRK